MPEQDPRPAQKPPGRVGESVLESPGEVIVTHHPTPPKTRGDKPIHPRRPLRLVPAAPQETDGERTD
jgi:hypothetical protein